MIERYFHKGLFIIGHQLVEPSFFSLYKKLVMNQFKSYTDLKIEQEKNLRYIIRYAYENVPYYHRLFNQLRLNHLKISAIEDLEKLPILTKDIIKQNWKDFTPIGLYNMKYNIESTGGSTGTPFQYRISRFDRFFGGALLYRGWGYGGYELADKMIFLAGSSLDVGKKPTITKYIHELVRNIKKLSSFDMSEWDMKKYVGIINSFKPKFFRGYASSIYFFADWIEQNNIKIHSPLAIFTTAEKLHPYMRKRIEDILNCAVFDGYGLNDGGVSACECSEHTGFHIDTERSIMEIVDDKGEQLQSGNGRILATSLHNSAMTFIRYDTGDIGCITEEKCSCGRNYPMLKEIIGRSVDILITPEGKSVHGWFFLYIFWEYCKGIKKYQVIQEKRDKIIINLVIDNQFEESQLDKIRDIIRQKSEGWNIEFIFVDKIEGTSGGKYKFIVNKIGG